MRKVFLILLLVLLVIACREPKPEKVSIDGVVKTVRVGELLLSGQPSKAGLKNLADLGYKTVLSVRGETEVKWDEPAAVDSLGMAFFSIPMPGSGNEITDEQVSQFDKLLNSAKKPLVLHCGSGNRISGLWAVWLVEYKKVAPEKALALATQTGMKSVRKAVEKRLGLEVIEK